MCVSTGVVPAAHTLVDRAGFTFDKLALSLHGDSELDRHRLTVFGVAEFRFPTGALSHTS